MNLAKIITFLFCAAAVQVRPYAQRQFFVSPLGCDRIDYGTSEKPFKTPAFAISQATSWMKANRGEDAEVVFRNGTYYVTRQTDINGTNIDGSLTLRASESGKATFDGSKAAGKAVFIKNVRGGKLYKASVPASVFPWIGELATPYNRFEVYLGERRLQPARYPDEGFLEISEVYGTTPTENGAFKEGVISCSDRGFLRDIGGESDVWLHGFWNYGWDDSYQKVKTADARRGIITLSDEGNRYGYREGGKFYAIGAKRFLNMPGEYWLSRKAREIWFVAPARNDDPQIRVCSDAVTSVFNVKNMKGLKVMGLNFTRTCNFALRIADSPNAEVLRCNFTLTGADALRISGARGCSVRNCIFSHLSAHAVTAEGGDRKSLKSSGTQITGCTMSDISTFAYAYCQAVNFSGCGLLVSGNRFSGMPGSAIRIDGNNAVVEHNLFERLALVCDDQGGADMYGDPSFRGVVFRFNHWRDISDPEDKRMIAAIRFDYMISGERIYGNMFERCGSGGFGAVQLLSGKDNKVYANCFSECGHAVSFTPYIELWRQELNTEEIRKKIYKDVDIRSAVYRDAYPELEEDLALHPDRNYIGDNIFAACRGTFSILRGQQMRSLIKGNISRRHAMSVNEFNRWLRDKGITHERIGLPQQ